MSAMHWEARRRQTVLDRRVMTDKQQLPNEFSEASLKAMAETSSAEQQTCTSGDQNPGSQDNVRTPVHYDAKIPNRYSSTQYIQQW